MGRRQKKEHSATNSAFIAAFSSFIAFITLNKPNPIISWSSIGRKREKSYITIALKNGNSALETSLINAYSQTQKMARIRECLGDHVLS